MRLLVALDEPADILKSAESAITADAHEAVPGDCGEDWKPPIYSMFDFDDLASFHDSEASDDETAKSIPASKSDSTEVPSESIDSCIDDDRLACSAADFQPACVPHSSYTETCELFSAIQRHDIETTQALISRGVSPNLHDAAGMTPLLKAMQLQNFKMCAMLLAFGADSQQLSPRDVVRAAPTTMIANLVAEGWQNPWRIHLRLAAATGDESAVRILLEVRRSRPVIEGTEDGLLSVDLEGNTALHLCAARASTEGHIHVLKALLEAGSPVDMTDFWGETPLKVAVRAALAGKEEFFESGVRKHICAQLLECKADVNAADLALLETPLMLVARAGSPALLHLLLSAKADVLRANSEGFTALDLAEEGSVRSSFVSEFLCRGLIGNTVPRTRPALSSTPPTVSVICPTTTGRAAFHRNIYMCFVTQTLSAKELIIVDTGTFPSVFFSSPPASEDKRVKYHFCKDEVSGFNGQDQESHLLLPSSSIGAKRNFAVSLARGSLIAHFDDDDLYAPRYLETMVDVAARHNAHAVKLSSWFTFHVPSGLVGFCDPELNENTTIRDHEILGYGFSYVYQRSVAIEYPFPEVSFGEDYEFMASLQKAGFSICLWPDVDCCCMHLQHGRNTSFNAACDQVPRDALQSSQLSESPLFAPLLKLNPQRSTTCSVVPSPQGESRSPLLSLALTVLQSRSSVKQRPSRSSGSSGGVEGLLSKFGSLDPAIAQQLASRPSFQHLTRGSEGSRWERLAAKARV